MDRGGIVRTTAKAVVFDGEIFVLEGFGGVKLHVMSIKVVV